MPYFAYGSNLNAADLKAWCTRQRLPYPLGDIVGRAWLPDYQLVFDTWSGTRRGGVANVVPRMGHAVPGGVFKVKKHGWDILSIKEGAPGFYSKQGVFALVENVPGMTTPVSCTTYLLPPSDTFVSPSVTYLRAVAGGYAAYNLPEDMLLHASCDQGNPLLLFVYGTLQRGKRLHGHMEGFEFLGEVVVPGRLLDCGSFPGLIQGEAGERVHGEIYQVKAGCDVEELLGRVDRIEGFGGFDRNNLYQRRIITATDAGGKETGCWTYHWMGSRELSVVEGGVWGGSTS
jgi:gamma-glutamylcyclotransferase (GGCT)/AIG2-like uncharacterized protein YtfP